MSNFDSPPPVVDDLKFWLRVDTGFFLYLYNGPTDWAPTAWAVAAEALTHLFFQRYISTCSRPRLTCPRIRFLLRVFFMPLYFSFMIIFLIRGCNSRMPPHVLYRGYGYQYVTPTRSPLGRMSFQPPPSRIPTQLHHVENRNLAHFKSEI